jgi:hypothetical protein
MNAGATAKLAGTLVGLTLALAGCGGGGDDGGADCHHANLDGLANILAELVRALLQLAHFGVGDAGGLVHALLKTSRLRDDVQRERAQ